MTLHFDTAEYAKRLDRAKAALGASDLDALLMFAPESQFWISGYDTFGFAMFQCMILTRDGALHLLTRMPDLRQAQQTSTLPDDHIHIWTETFDSNPATDLAHRLNSGAAPYPNLAPNKIRSRGRNAPQICCFVR